jgi:hypothetical protein
MRAPFVLFCAAVTACAQQDQRPVASPPAVASTSASTIGIADSSFTPLEMAEPALPAWTPPPGDPGDTSPQGFPTEHALLRWVHRFPPDSFPELPRTVRDSLVSRSCQIPTPSTGRVNVITGAFTAKGAVEWAVVCSVHDTSQILIFSAANGAAVDSLSKSGDSQWIQSSVGKTWLFSRQISVVPMSRLNIVPVDTTIEDVLYYGRVLPKPIDHDGIDEAFLEKASETFYFARGKWFSVSSGD